MVKQHAEVIKSDTTLGPQIIKAGRIKVTYFYDENMMFTDVEVEGTVHFSDLELLSLMIPTSIIRVG